jgi:DNA mismatch repair protein PMS2
MLTRIDSASVLQICSAQVIPTLQSAVKELFENAIDSGAQFIDIKFTNYGYDAVEVSDNGQGIKQSDFNAVCKRGTTSKIKEFDDIYQIQSLGFRGEALSSLCSIANVTIETMHKQDSSGSILVYNHQGDLIKNSKISRQQGTKVVLSELFANLPVRQQEYKKHYKKQY